MAPVKLDLNSLRKNRWVKILGRIITLEGIAVVAGILLTGGLINYLLEGSSIPADVVLTHSLEDQSILETIAYVIAATLGFGGLYMVWRSSQPSKTWRESFLVYITGFLLLMIGFFLFFSIYTFKVGG